MHLVCWPGYGSGNALMKCLTAHDAYSYNPDWNMWGPLEWVLQPPPTMTSETFTSHLGDIWGEHTIDPSKDFIDQLEHVLQRKQLTNREMQWLNSVIKEDASIVYGVPGHIPASQIVDQVKRPVVQLVARDYDSILKRADPQAREWAARNAHTERVLGHLQTNAIVHPLVLNLCIEDFFFSDYSTFVHVYNSLRTHLDLEDRSEQVWAFILYYKDRVQRDVDEKHIAQSY